jgi:hypothetical protein
MALLYIDGFDTYGVNSAGIQSALNLADYMNSTGFGGTPNPSATNNTRTGIGFAMNTCTNVEGGYILRNFPTTSGIITGFAVLVQDSGYVPLCSLGYNNYIGGSFIQLSVAANGANGITAQTGNGGASYSSAPNVLFEGVWQFIEIKYTPGTTTSYLEVRVDGVTVISVTNETLVYTGLPSLTNFFRFEGPGANKLFVDDWYLEDSSGSSFNDFLGDVVVHDLLPVADAGTNQMAMTGGSGGHYTTVDDVPADGDTSYLSSNTSGQEETFTLGPLPSDILTVLAVGVCVAAKKTAPGLAVYKSLLITGGLESDSPEFSAPISYVTTQFLMPQPPGGGAWTNSALTSATVGFKLI